MRSFDKALREMREDFSRIATDHVERHDRRIELFEMGGWGEEPSSVGINWSAIGTVDAATAREFGELLIAAADYAESIDDYMKQEEGR